MRFREFNRRQNVSELVPAIGQGLRAVGGAAIKATQNAVGMATKSLGKLAPTKPGTPAAPTTGADKTKTAATDTVASIPAVGSEIVLPDKDTKRPASFTIKGVKGGEVELQPVTTASKSGDPKVSVKVRMQDLQNTMKALTPDDQQGQTKQ